MTNSTDFVNDPPLKDEEDQQDTGKNKVSSLAALRVFTSSDGQYYYPISDRAKVEARICAGILGTGPLTLQMMLTEKWAKAVYSLSHRGVSRAGFARYLATASMGAITDPLFPAFNQATRPFWKIEQIPNLFLDTQSLAHKRPALKEYAAKLKREQLFDPEILEKIQQELLDDKLKYFGTEVVDVVIVVKETVNPGVRDNVRQAFARLPPAYKSIRGIVRSEGTHFQPWEISVDGFIGASRTKNEARMIAVIKRYFDPSFNGSSPIADDAVPRSAQPIDVILSTSSVMARMVN